MDLATYSRNRLLRVASSMLIAFVLVLFSGAGAQEPEGGTTAQDGATEEAVELVAAAFESADHEALLDLAHRRVEIMILGQGARYSHSQAEMVLRNFFRRNPPDRVDLSEQLAAGDDRSASGRYWVESHENPLILQVGFRVVDGDEWQLASIQIDRPTFRGSSNG